MKDFDVLQELFMQYDLGHFNTLQEDEIKAKAITVTEAVESLDSALKFDATMIPVVEYTQDNGEKLVVIEARDLVRFMENAECADTLAAIKTVCDKNLVPDDATFTKAILVDESKVKFIKEAAKQNTFSEEAAALVGLLENLQSNGIKIVTKSK